jgi:hypothetical protein
MTLLIRHLSTFLVLTSSREEDRTPARYRLLATCCGMPTFRLSELYHNCVKLQSASCSSTGRLENPGCIHRGCNDNCSILCPVSFYERKNEIDGASQDPVPCLYSFSTSRIQIDEFSILPSSPPPGRCERHRGGRLKSWPRRCG